MTSISELGTHKVTSSNTLWVIIQSTVAKDFVRHFNDLAFSVHTLKLTGVPEDNILIFTNDYLVSTTQLNLSEYSINSKVFDLTNLNLEIAKTPGTFENVLFVVGGHGSVHGIHVKGNIFYSPVDIINSIRSVPNISAGGLVLCQCYSGIFNYVDAKSSPELFIMAGTNLKLSLSLYIKLMHPIKSNTGDEKRDIKEWNANPFQYYFFEWLSNPSDIDGDGIINILDAYRYAGSCSNDTTIDIKGKILIELSTRLSVYRKLSNKWFKTKAQQELMKDYKAYIDSASNSLYNVESPWLLNPLFGRKIHF